MAITKKEKTDIIKEILKELEKPVTIGINLMDQRALIPTKAHKEDACWDIYALETTNLESQRTVIVRTGISLEIPEGYMVELRPRSGLAYERGVTIQNSPATIDAGYKNEILLIMHNHNLSMPYIANRGSRIAQMRLVKLTNMKIKEKVVHGVKDRGGGLGSTDK